MNADDTTDFHARLQERLQKIKCGRRRPYFGQFVVDDPGKKSTLAYFARRMRDNPTTAEACLWRKLRSPPWAHFRFRTQWIINRFIVDFYSRRYRLIVEVDGPSHGHNSRQYDLSRQEDLIARGFTILRFSNKQVRTDIQNVLLAIEYAAINSPPRT